MYLPIFYALISFGIADTTPDAAVAARDEAFGSAPSFEAQSFETSSIEASSFETTAADETRSSPALFTPEETLGLFLATDGEGGSERPKSWISAQPLDKSDFGNNDFRRRGSAESGVGARVRDLVRRQMQAGRWLYGDTQLAELDARGTLLIEWLDQGRTPVPEQVEQLAQHVSRLEERVTERLARDYRIAIYNTFRTDREEFNHRRARWKLIDERWRKSEHTPERRTHLNQWLAEAIEVSQPESTTPLPPAPAWYYEPDKMLAQQDDSQQNEDDQADQADQADPFDESSPGDLVDTTPLLDVRNSSDVPPRQPADTFLTVPENTDSFAPVEISPADDKVLLGPSPVGVDPTTDRVPDDFDSALSASVLEDLFKRGRSEQPNTTTAADDAPVDLTDLLEEEPTERQPEQAVVNVDLLTARVAGHNLAVVGLSEELRERSRWTAASLAPQVNRLIELHERRKDLVVFVELLEPQQRRRLEEVETTKRVVTLLAEKIVGARLWTMGDTFDGNPQQRQAELAALAEFSRRLAEIAFDSPRQGGVVR